MVVTQERLLPRMSPPMPLHVTWDTPAHTSHVKREICTQIHKQKERERDGDERPLSEKAIPHSGQSHMNGFSPIYSREM